MSADPIDFAAVLSQHELHRGPLCEGSTGTEHDSDASRCLWYGLAEQGQRFARELANAWDAGAASSWNRHRSDWRQATNPYRLSPEPMNLGSTKRLHKTFTIETIAEFASEHSRHRRDADGSCPSGLLPAAEQHCDAYLLALKYKDMLERGVEKDTRPDVLALQPSRAASAAEADSRTTPDDAGLRAKYRVERVDPDAQERHRDCWMFVLEPEHDEAARAALAAYADAVEHMRPALAADLRRVLAAQVAL